MKCAVCGKEFTPTRITQRYCGYTCRRYANHHGINDNRVEGPLYAPVIREFTCLRCGKHVRVTDGRDCRTKFCSQHCEKLQMLSALLRRMLQQNLTKQSNFILEPVVMDVMQSSRSVVRLYYHTEQVKQ